MIKTTVKIDFTCTGNRAEAIKMAIHIINYLEHTGTEESEIIADTADGGRRRCGRAQIKTVFPAAGDWRRRLGGLFKTHRFLGRK